MNQDGRWLLCFIPLGKFVCPFLLELCGTNCKLCYNRAHVWIKGFHSFWLISISQLRKINKEFPLTSLSRFYLWLKNKLFTKQKKRENLYLLLYFVRIGHSCFDMPLISPKIILMISKHECTVIIYLYIG